MYRIALLGWLRGVRGPLFAIPTLGIAKVVSLHIEELHLVAELLKKMKEPLHTVWHRLQIVRRRIFQ